MPLDRRAGVHPLTSGGVVAVRAVIPVQRPCHPSGGVGTSVSSPEIADTLGLPINSVKTHCRRGLAALQGLLPRLAPDEDEAVSRHRELGGRA